MRVVFQNYTDRGFRETVRHEIKNIPEIKLKGFEDEQPLNKVTYLVDIIPGKEILDDFFEVLDEQNSFRDKMQEIWDKYCNEVN